MFSPVSWNEYLTVVASCLFIWYISILLIFCRKDIRKYLGNKNRTETGKQIEEIPEANSANTNSSDTRIEPLQAVQMIIADIKKIFSSVGKETPSSTIISDLNNILSKYPQLKYSEFKAPIGELIQSNVSRIGLSPLSPDELEMIWKFNN